MSTEQWHLVSPVGAPINTEILAPVIRREGNATVVGFLSNRKPNTAMMQRALSDRLRVSGFETRFYEKSNSAVSASQVLLSKIAEECGAVINGTGD